MQRPGGPNLLQRVVELYMESAPTLLETLRGALESRDPEALAGAAHSLKSSSANVGAVHLSALCAELERLGRGGDLRAVATLVTGVEEELVRVQEALRQTAGLPA
jgi:HPt (histidine-containing phosphotransfer) domain-containing protein